MKPLRKFLWGLSSAVALAILAIFLAFRPDEAIRVATGVTSHTLCSAVFVSRLDPDEAYAETVKPTPGLKQLDWAIRYVVDRSKRMVTTTWAYHFESRAVFQDGMGCTLIRDRADAAQTLLSRGPGAQRDAATARASDTAGSTILEPVDKKLQQALDTAFVHRATASLQLTKAIVVIHARAIIAERYAPGYSIDTPALGWSMTKSVINALVGILIRQGRLAVDQPAPVPAWSDAHDARRAITIDQLMRMTSGLAIHENDSGFDPATRMLFLEADMAAFAERSVLEDKPRSQWSCTGGNTLILSRIIQDATGGTPNDFLHFARHELFEPLDMKSVVVEFDAAGTPIGSTYMFASARDWARFGLLYLNDGVVGERRILPENWVRYWTTPSIRRGYGAGWWTNREPSGAPSDQPRLGLPSDAFWAAGALGQRLVVAPSERLVIVRLGARADMASLARLVTDVIASLHERREGDANGTR
jgi:CubicO group peptidase (beta-lactamase class C family)